MSSQFESVNGSNLQNCVTLKMGGCCSRGAIDADMDVESKSNSKQKVVICGGGNAAHVFTVLAAQDPNNEVHLMSLYSTEAKDFETALSETEDKSITIEVTQEKKQIKGKPASISNDPKILVDADIVIISLPAFAHNQYLQAIKENIKPREKMS